jgi:hypothetical protein
VLTPTERKVSCHVTYGTHVVWICNGVLIGKHSVHQTCNEDEQLVLEVLIRIFVVYSVPIRGCQRSGLSWVVHITTSLSHTHSFTYFIQLCSLLTVHGCLFNIQGYS